MHVAMRRWRSTLDYRSGTGELNAMLVQVLLDRLRNNNNNNNASTRQLI